MTYESAAEKDLEDIYTVVQQTVKTIYPNYYLTEVVRFFCELHSREAILKDIRNGYVSFLKVDGKIIGTGSFIKNHVTRVYVLPEYQKKGYGTFIMKSIEAEIAKRYEKVYLEASLPAVGLYEKLGYTTMKHDKFSVENEVVLVYEIMEKNVRATVESRNGSLNNTKI